MYCLLSELKERLKDGPLPPVLFIQIDGGPENSNVTMLALCELLVARGIIREKIVLCRLPVGHTHEDIDAVFALIWQRIKNGFVFTPQQYEVFILQALAKKALVQQVKYVFVIPNLLLLFGSRLNCRFQRTLNKNEQCTKWDFTSCKVDNAKDIAVAKMKKIATMRMKNLLGDVAPYLSGTTMVARTLGVVALYHLTKELDITKLDTMTTQKRNSRRMKFYKLSMILLMKIIKTLSVF